jgi:hypothetical protein
LKDFLDTKIDNRTMIFVKEPLVNGVLRERKLLGGGMIDSCRAIGDN